MSALGIDDGDDFIVSTDDEAGSSGDHLLETSERASAISSEEGSEVSAGEDAGQDDASMEEDASEGSWNEQETDEEEEDDGAGNDTLASIREHSNEGYSADALRGSPETLQRALELLSRSRELRKDCEFFGINAMFFAKLRDTGKYDPTQYYSQPQNKEPPPVLDIAIESHENYILTDIYYKRKLLGRLATLANAQEHAVGEDSGAEEGGGYITKTEILEDDARSEGVSSQLSETRDVSGQGFEDLLEDVKNNKRQADIFERARRHAGERRAAVKQVSARENGLTALNF